MKDLPIFCELDTFTVKDQRVWGVFGAHEFRGLLVLGYVEGENGVILFTRFGNLRCLWVNWRSAENYSGLTKLVDENGKL